LLNAAEADQRLPTGFVPMQPACDIPFDILVQMVAKLLVKLLLYLFPPEQRPHSPPQPVDHSHIPPRKDFNAAARHRQFPPRLMLSDESPFRRS
jgi:hypothetical protein